PVHLDNFEEYVNRMHRDSDYLFSEEYAAIQQLAPKIEDISCRAPREHQIPCHAAKLDGNKEKNRFTDILPFDFSRVKLLPIDDDDECSDYINASSLPGVSSKTEYIAAQGPKSRTVNEFWRMIWEQNSSIIVMVTNLLERGKAKCFQYWPNADSEPVLFCDLQVQLRSESVIGKYIIR
ncbi:hypothetical protein CAPTEDRAFT_81278, partial [Capitella teleta]